MSFYRNIHYNYYICELFRSLLTKKTFYIRVLRFCIVILRVKSIDFIFFLGFGVSYSNTHGQCTFLGTSPIYSSQTKFGTF